MLRWPVRISLILAAIVAFILGAHGLYTYFEWSDASNPFAMGFIFGMAGVDPEWYFSRLFLSVDVPSMFRSTILWASIRGLESWFVPTCLVVASFVLLYLQSNIYTRRLWLPRPIRKLRSKLW